jgi:hypothetical protein
MNDRTFFQEVSLDLFLYIKINENNNNNNIVGFDSYREHIYLRRGYPHGYCLFIVQHRPPDFEAFTALSPILSTQPIPTHDLLPRYLNIYHYYVD